MVLGCRVNWLSARLSLAANAFYVFGYTMLLKRRTTQNIVWGGLAGCFPALIGWTAVTGELAWTPVVLFLVVFFWTPPHTWALALRYREDYAAVDVPMLPVVARPPRSVARSSSTAGSWSPRRCSCGRSPTRAWSTRWPRSCSAPSSWSRPTGCGRRARATDELSEINPMRLFHASNLYLSLLFVAVALDPLLG